MPTQREGETLDLVITTLEQSLDNMSVQPQNVISDHSMITWQLLLQHQQPITEQREVRSWKKLDTYQRVLQSLADTFVPVRQLKVRRQPITIWMGTECHQLLHHSRMLVRRYRRTKSPADRQADR